MNIKIRMGLLVKKRKKPLLFPRVKNVKRLSVMALKLLMRLNLSQIKKVKRVVEVDANRCLILNLGK